MSQGTQQLAQGRPPRPANAQRRAAETRRARAPSRPKTWPPRSGPIVPPRPVIRAAATGQGQEQQPRRPRLCPRRPARGQPPVGPGPRPRGPVRGGPGRLARCTRPPKDSVPQPSRLAGEVKTRRPRGTARAKARRSPTAIPDSGKPMADPLGPPFAATARPRPTSPSSRLMIKAKTGRNWGELPGHLRTEILQMSQGRYRDDYARLIQLYFREIAAERRPAAQSHEVRRAYSLLPRSHRSAVGIESVTWSHSGRCRRSSCPSPPRPPRTYPADVAAARKRSPAADAATVATGIGLPEVDARSPTGRGSRAGSAGRPRSRRWR